MLSVQRVIILAGGNNFFGEDFAVIYPSRETILYDLLG